MRRTICFGSVPAIISGHGQIVESTKSLANSHQIDQSLCWVIMSAIPGINDRDFRIHGRTKRCPFLRMAHDNDICITTNDPYRIRNCLPFGNARLVRPCESNRLSTKTEHCRFKRKPRSGTCLLYTSHQKYCHHHLSENPALPIAALIYWLHPSEMD